MLSDEELVSMLIGAGYFNCADDEEGKALETELLSRLKAAREDTERLDWCETYWPDITCDCGAWILSAVNEDEAYGPLANFEGDGKTLRAAIDAARKAGGD